jgi:hypothetical protein
MIYISLEVKTFFQEYNQTQNLESDMYFTRLKNISYICHQIWQAYNSGKIVWYFKHKLLVKNGTGRINIAYQWKFVILFY